MAYRAVLRELDNKVSILEAQTVRLNAKEEYIDSTSKVLASLVDQCPLPIWIKDLSGTMIFFNDAYAKIYGVDIGSYINKKDDDVWPKDVADVFVNNDHDVMQGNPGYKVEIIPSTNKHKPSDNRDFITVVKWRVSFEGRVIGVAGIVTSVFP